MDVETLIADAPGQRRMLFLSLFHQHAHIAAEPAM
jgi:hypothetical protein